MLKISTYIYIYVTFIYNYVKMFYLHVYKVYVNPSLFVIFVVNLLKMYATFWGGVEVACTALR